MKRLTLLLTIALMASLSAQAEIFDFNFNFDSITSYTNDGYQSVVSQLSMGLVVVDDTSAQLVFANAGPVTSTVAGIYFDYAPENDLGLEPKAPAGWTLVVADPPPPVNLPAGNDFGFFADFRLSPDDSPAQNGIILESSLTVDLIYDSDFDILAALNSGHLRVGLHTIGIIDTTGRVVMEGEEGEEGEIGEPWSYSESSINNIPEPASLALLVGSSALIGFIRKRFIV